MTSDRARRLVGGIVIWTAIAGALWVSIGAPFLDMCDLGAEIRMLEAQRPKLVERVEAGRHLVTVEHELEVARQRIVGRLDDRTGIEDALRQAIAEVGGETLSIRRGRSADDPGITLDIRLIGTGLEALLVRLEYGRPPLLIDQLSVRRLADADAGSDTLDIRVEARLPLQRKEQP